MGGQPPARVGRKGQGECLAQIVVSKEEALPRKHTDAMILLSLGRQKQLRGRAAALVIHRFHQFPQDAHLLRTYMVQRVLPHIAHAKGAGHGGRVEKLLDAVVPVGMAHGPLEYRPVGIPPHIPLPPVGLGQVVQPLQDLLVGGFAVHGGLQGFPGQVPVHIAPVVLTEIGFRIQAVVVPCAKGHLVIAPVAGLEHVEVQPFLLMEPQRGRGAPEGVIANQPAWIQLLEQPALPAIQVMAAVAADISAQQPDDVGRVRVALRQEGDVAVDILLVEPSLLHHAAPGRQQGHVQPQLLRHAHHLVHKGPVGGIGSVLFHLRQAGGRHALQAMDQHRLNHREALVPAVLQVQAGLLLITYLAQQPGGVAQVKEGHIAIAQIAAVVRHTKRAMLPRLLTGHDSISSFSPHVFSTSLTFSTCPEDRQRPMASITAMVRMPSFRSGRGVSPAWMQRAKYSR